MWSLGQILYQCMTGKKLYNGEDLADIGHPKGGYKALMKGELRGHLTTMGLLNKFKVSSFKLLTDLLRMDPKQRITAAEVVSHDWFKPYVCYTPLAVYHSDCASNPVLCWMNFHILSITTTASDIGVNIESVWIRNMRWTLKL